MQSNENEVRITELARKDGADTEQAHVLSMRLANHEATLTSIRALACELEAV